MSSSLTVKAFLREGEAECRRFKPNEEQIGSIDKLKEKLVEVFPSLQDKAFTVTYRDQDGDDIVIGSDEELAVVAEEVIKRKEDLLKINVKYIKKAETKENIKGPSCNVCKEHLFDIHFQCLQCPSYWLCQSCEKKGEHYQHSMMRLRQPLPTQEQIMEQFAPWISMWTDMMGCSDNRKAKETYCSAQRSENNNPCGSSTSERSGELPQMFNLSEFITQMMGGGKPTEQGATGGSGIACDACKTTLNNINFKCLQCTNYHLCVECESKGVHQDHNMIRFTFPMPSQEEMMKHLQPWLSIFCNKGKQSKSEGSTCYREQKREQKPEQSTPRQTDCPMFGDFSQLFSGGCRDDARRQSPEEIIHQILRAGTTAAEMFAAMGAKYQH